MSKKLRCAGDRYDWVEVNTKAESRFVEVDVSIRGKREQIFLTPSDARKLRKQIKKALEAIEGVDEELTEEVKPEIKVGDKVRIVGDSVTDWKGLYKIGDVHTVLAIDTRGYRLGLGGALMIWFPASSVEPA